MKSNFYIKNIEFLAMFLLMAGCNPQDGAQIIYVSTASDLDTESDPAYERSPAGELLADGFVRFSSGRSLEIPFLSVAQSQLQVSDMDRYIKAIRVHAYFRSTTKNFTVTLRSPQGTEVTLGLDQNSLPGGRSGILWTEDAYEDVAAMCIGNSLLQMKDQASNGVWTLTVESFGVIPITLLNWNVEISDEIQTEGPFASFKTQTCE